MVLPCILPAFPSAFSLFSCFFSSASLLLFYPLCILT
ncbi:putative membrane protein, partial [Chlamydia psittaci 84-8471/1]